MPEKLIDLVRSPKGPWRLPAALGVVILMATGAWLVLATGDPSAPLANVMYIPILLAAVFFQRPGGVVAGAMAAFLLGPLSPVSPDPAGWIVRGACFILAGGLAGHAQHLLELRLSQGRDLVDRLRAVHARTLSTFASTVDLHDGPTGGHSARVAHNARVLATALELDEETVHTAYWGGLLHDLGKIAIPERILQKPGRLTPVEMEAIRTHSDVGADLLLSVSLELGPIADAVRAHHERWNGTGYPQGLAREDIPLTGRILNLVDVFEALTCERPYRLPTDPGDVLAMLLEQAGSRFDPDLVAVFEDLFWRGAIHTAVDTDAPILEEVVLITENRESETQAPPVVVLADYQLGSSGRP